MLEILIISAALSGVPGPPIFDNPPTDRQLRDFQRWQARQAHMVRAIYAAQQRKARLRARRYYWHAGANMAALQRQAIQNAYRRQFRGVRAGYRPY